MSTIFISHSSKDNSVAEAIVERLQQQGYQSVFLDFDPELGIPAGRSWEHELYRQLRACQSVIVLCSEHSMASRWCFAEITHAKSLGKYLFPLKIGPCKIDTVLTSRQIIDFTKDPEAAYQRLWEGLRIAGLDPADHFTWDTSRSPYPGMMAFEEADAAVFFGREAEIQQGLEILQRLRQFGGARVLMVLGASGTGKSSVVRAGLLPRLRRNSEEWLIIDPFRPQAHPLRELSIALAGAFPADHPNRDWNVVLKQVEDAEAEGGSHGESILNSLALDLKIALQQRRTTLLMVIDQAEELLTRSDEGRAAIFLTRLRSALESADCAILVVMTLRSDFLADFQRLPELLDFPCEHLPIKPMALQHIERVIEGPATIAGIELEDGLTRIMLQDTQNQDTLPLLAFTLRELYDKYGDDKLFEVNEYQKRLGGLAGAVSSAADAVLRAAGLSDDKKETDQKRLLKKAFIELVRINRDGQFTRQAARWSAFPESIHGVLERFVQARLLISGSEEHHRVLEVAHEALFYAWARMKKWLDENREFLLWRERFRERLHEWQRTGEDPQALLTGSALNEARSWVERHGDQFNAEENAFLAKSIRQVKRLKRRKSTAYAVLIVFLIAVAIGGNMLWQRAEKEKRYSIEQLAKNYWSNVVAAREKNDWLDLVHYSAKAGELTNDKCSVKNALHNIDHYISVFLGRFLKHDSSVLNAIYTKDKTRILTWSRDGTARLWDAVSGLSIGQPMKHDSDVLGAVFNHDETRILTWSRDGTARLWHAVSGASIGQPMKHDSYIYGAVFNHDETRILTWSHDGTARLWHAVSGASIGQPMKHDSDILGAMFNHDETRILTWSRDGTARLWHAVSGASIGQPMKHDSDILGAMFNHDETRILTWSRDGTARLWHAVSGASIGQPMKHDSYIYGAVFSHDETRILTWSHDGTARLWHAVSGASIGQPMKHDSDILGAVFSHDKTRILTWSRDGTARLWHAVSGASIGQPMKHDSDILGAVFSHDKTRILTWSHDGTARLWHAVSGASIGQPMKHSGSVNGAVFNHDETQILTWSHDGTARLWDAGNGASIGQPMKHAFSVKGTVFNHDETRILTWGDDNTARLWHAVSGASIGQPMKHAFSVKGAVFNHDETRILTWSRDNTARLWDAVSGLSIGQPMKHDRSVYGPMFNFVNGAVFNHDGTRILTWGGDNTARLWDAVNGLSIGQPMKHDRSVYGPMFNFVNGAVFNHDGTRILTCGGDGTARLWDAVSGLSIGQPMKHSGSVNGAVFNHDETRILTWSNDDTARLWDAVSGVSIGQPMKHSGSVNGAVFNHDETRILTWGNDGTARLWDAVSGVSIGQPMKHSGSVNGAVFNHDETRILTWDSHNTAQLWDAVNGLSIGQPMEHDHSVYGAVLNPFVNGAVFNHDETRILTWSYDGTARLWDAVNCSSIGYSMKHDGSVLGAVFNHDETRILTWSEDGTARLWDAVNCFSISHPMKHDGSVLGAVFNHDETRILTWSEDGTARLWDTTIDEDFPKQHLSLLVSVATGTTMDDYGNITVLSKEKWEAYRKEYIDICEKHLKTCKYKKKNLYLKYQKPMWSKQ